MGHSRVRGLYAFPLFLNHDCSEKKKRASDLKTKHLRPFPDGKRACTPCVQGQKYPILESVSPISESVPEEKTLK
jgi:hypothetical protein